MYVNACKSLGDKYVSFLGFMDNNSEEFMNIVAKAKLFVLPSLNEVLPISVFESLILGTLLFALKIVLLAHIFQKRMVVLCVFHILQKVF